MSAVQATSKINDAAQLLLGARRSGVPLRELPEEVAPTSVEEAYAIQDAIARILGGVAGWKVGSKGPQQEPSCAPLFAAGIRHSGCTFLPRDCRLRGVEGEIAVRLNRDLPQRQADYTAAEVVAAIGEVLPAIEVVDSRFADMKQQDAFSLLADSLSNAGLVLGQAGEGLLPRDPAQQHAEIFFNQRRMAGGAGGNTAGDLVRLLVWLANHVAKRAGGLRAGEVVTTGSWTGMLFTEPHAHVKAVLAGCGEVELTFG